MFKKLRNYFCWHQPADSDSKHFDGLSKWDICRKCGREICLTSQGWV